MRVFWDTNLFIYLIERHAAFYPKVASLYCDLQKRGDHLVTSTLTLGELLAQPLRLGRSDLARQYGDLLTNTPGVELAAFDSVAASHYGSIRATTSLKQPDAIQVACAIATGAELFFTNDQQLWGTLVPGLAIRGLES